MLDPIADLYQYLSGQTTITQLLDSYGSAPAIFSGQVPADHVISQPVVILDYPIFNERRQTTSSTNREIETGIRVYAQVQSTNGFNTLPLQQASETIAQALVTARINITGGTLRGARVKGPIHVPSEDQSLSGRLISVWWRVEES